MYHGEWKEMRMRAETNTLIVPVTDLDQAKRLYGRLLGVAPYADQPSYVGFRVGDRKVGLDLHVYSKGMTAPIGYWRVDDIEETVKLLVNAGAEVQQAIKDVGAGTLIAWVKDPDGNTIGLRQSPYTTQEKSHCKGRQRPARSGRSGGSSRPSSIPRPRRSRGSKGRRRRGWYSTPTWPTASATSPSATTSSC